MLASFFLLACARLALRLAQLLCVRLRTAFSASPFASSASRSGKLEDISTEQPPEHEARKRCNFSAPWLWLKCLVLLPIASREGGEAPRSRRPGEAAPSATLGTCWTATLRRRRLSRKKNKRACARTRRAYGTSCSARTRRVSNACTQHASGASSGAHTARPATRNLRVLRRAEQGVSWRADKCVSRRADKRISRRAEERVPRRAEQRVSRRSTGASPDLQTSASSSAQLARLCGVRFSLHAEPVCCDSCFGAVIFSGLATFVFNHRTIRILMFTVCR